MPHRQKANEARGNQEDKEDKTKSKNKVKEVVDEGEKGWYISICS
mgnify:FL=1